MSCYLIRLGEGSKYVEDGSSGKGVPCLLQDMQKPLAALSVPGEFAVLPQA